MADTSTNRLSALAYYMMLIIGIAFSLAGVTTKAIAGTFAVDTSIVGYRFTLFSLGYSLAILGNGFILDKINIRTETLSALLLAVLAGIGATYWQSLGGFSFFVFFYGLGLGIICSVAYYLIVRLYNEAGRAAKLNLLNFFFSAGAIAAPLLSGLALEQGTSWQLIFQATLVLVVICGYLVYSQPFALMPRQTVGTSPDVNEPWNAKVYLSGLALLSYVISEMVFTYWVVLYMMDVRNIHVALASMSLSVFWTFMAAGRLWAGFFIGKFRLIPFLVLCSGAALISYLAMLKTSNALAAIALTGLMGLFYSALYATIMSYGTLQISGPSAKLTSFYLTIGAAGGILSFLLSSYLKACFDINAVLTLSAGLMAAVMAICAVCGFLPSR